jgi:hypothetical protein
VKSILRHIAPFALLCAVLAAAVTGDAKDPKRVEARLGKDSTIFSLRVDHRGHLKSGEVFAARIHVNPGKHIHIWGCKMSPEGGLVPLNIQIPDSISEYFKLESVSENGTEQVGYDSNFGTVTYAHNDPYDVIAKIKVKRIANAEVPFYLFVRYQANTEKSCFPPCAVAVPMSVLGEKPVMLPLGRTRNRKRSLPIARS